MVKTMSQAQISPRQRALLNTISYAEGTWRNGQVGYNIMFGGGTFDPSKGHPDRVVDGGRYKSAAAGGYQFMPFTFNEVTRQNGWDPRDFGPAAQDRAALALVRRRGANSESDFTPELVNKLAPEWASFPTLKGNSFYGQPVKRFDELKRFYDSQLKLAGSGGAQAAPASTAQPAPAASAGPGVGVSSGDDGADVLALATLLGGNALTGGSRSNPLQALTDNAVMDFATSSGENTAQQLLLRQQAESLGTEALTGGRRAQLAAARRREGGRGGVDRMAASRGIVEWVSALAQPLGNLF
ncbi:MAG: glycoside hydrolase family 104 protein [Cyanobacteriota bacterium]|nr:glycoside hydrolase family 104 protein [Cyanobacteriota bacterium]